jgi:hypothetical protein
MVAVDTEGFIYIIGHAVSNDDGKEFVYDDGCGCCSSSYSSYDTSSVHFVQYGWLIHNNALAAESNPHEMLAELPATNVHK